MVTKRNTIKKGGNEILKKAMIVALEKTLGIVSTACRKVKIARKTHYEWLKKDPEYKQQVNDIEEMAIDFVESKLMGSINLGSDTAIIFYLKTKGKGRGYVEKTETTVEFKSKQIIKIGGKEIEF